MQNYSQFKAMMALTKGALLAMFRSPSAIVFSIAFPLIFVMVFGLMGSGTATYKIYLHPPVDSLNPVYQALRKNPTIRFVPFTNAQRLRTDLLQGRITAQLNIEPVSNSLDKYTVQVIATTSSLDKLGALNELLENLVNRINQAGQSSVHQKVILLPPNIEETRKYRTIDFILPGQLGFSLLSAGIFGVAFLFFNLRQTLVIKRFFATPINRLYILLGEGLARLVFQLLAAIIIVLVGVFVFQFTLVNGLVTFLEILVLSAIALLVFMGFGFIVSGVAKSESAIPPLANLITMPQFLLAGTFFNIEVLPSWLQPFAKMLPLTFFNNAMRKISFEGAHLSDVGFEIMMLVIWGIIAYAIATKVFKWE